MELEDLVDGADDLLGVIRRENSLGGMCSLAVDRPGAFLVYRDAARRLRQDLVDVNPVLGEGLSVASKRLAAAVACRRFFAKVSDFGVIDDLARREWAWGDVQGE